MGHKNRMKAQRGGKMHRADGGNIRAAETSEAESKSDAFKKGGHAGKHVKAKEGGMPKHRLDKPKRRASGGALSSAAKVSDRKDGGAGSGHEDTSVGSGPGEE